MMTKFSLALMTPPMQCLHDVGFVHRSDPVSAVRLGVIEGKLSHTHRRSLRDQLDALYHPIYYLQHVYHISYKQF